MNRFLLLPVVALLGCGSADDLSGPTNGPSAANTTSPKSFDFTAGEKIPADAQTAQKYWSGELKREVVEENSIGMKLVLIPPGRFIMGSPDTEADRDADEIPHKVEISEPFYLGMYEVTNSEFSKVIPDHSSAYSVSDDVDTSRFPVNWLTWDNAKEFCQKLSELEGATYRLPTEAEWEYACRAGTTTPFSFGSQLNGDKANCYGEKPYGTSEAGPNLGRIADVGSYDANSFGLFDMHGNVWEMCSDWYDESYYDRSPAIDPGGPEDGHRKVKRGGGWSGAASMCRSADRSGSNHESPYDRIGFRVVMVP